MLRIALAQIAPSEDRYQNLSQARDLLQQAMDRKADLVVFPEHFSFFSPDSERLKKEAREKKTSVAVESLQEWSIEYGIWILAGALPFGPQGTKPTSVLWDIDGDPVTAHTHTDRGKLKLAPTPWGWLGLGHSPSDLHRPSAFHFTEKKKPIAWILTGTHSLKNDKTRWEVLTRARAIETGIPVFGVGICSDEVASPSGYQPLAHSRIVSADGRVLSERPRGAGIVWADVKPAE